MDLIQVIWRQSYRALGTVTCGLIAVGVHAADGAIEVII